MAQRVALIDDLDGSDGDQTVTYTVDGQEYEIDLSEANTQKFREALAPFIEKSRPVERQTFIPTTTKPTRRRTPSGGSSGGDSGRSETLTITSDTTLTEDHSGNIVIGMDSVRLDCAGHAILGDGSGAGLTLVGRTGVDVRNCVITGADEGIKLVGSSRNSFMLNEITNNRVGVSVESLDVLNLNIPSQGNEFRGNQVKKNDDEGFAVRDSHGNLFHANEVEENGRDGFDLNRSNNNAILANRVSMNGFNGIELDGSNNNVLNDNFSSKNGRLGNRSGFSLDNSSKNVFTDNFADENRRNGYRLTNNSDSNILQSNSACRNGEGAVFVDTMSVGNVTGDTRCDPIVDPLPG